MENICEIIESLASLGKNRSKKLTSPSEAQPEVDMTWPPHEDDFVITLDEQGWQLGSVQGYNPESDAIEVQCLEALKTRAKNYHGKTYWLFPSNDQQLQTK